jgi:hypothetical protein
VTSIGKLPGFTTERGYSVDTTAKSFRTKDDTPSVRRKGRFVVVGFMMRNTERLTSRDLLDPNVERALSAPVRCVGYEFAVG